MATKIYVGKLSYTTTSEALQTLFEQYGVVLNAQVITERDSNQSKGFAFVEMQELADAEAAIKALNGSEFDGRTIVVNIARPREERPQSDRNNSFRGGFDRRS